MPRDSEVKRVGQDGVLNIIAGLMPSGAGEVLFEGKPLAAIYRSLCPLLNYFMPTVKPVDKMRFGAEARKVYDKPTIPYRRLTGHPKLLEEVKDEMTRCYGSYTPVVLWKEVNAAIDALHRYPCAGRGTHWRSLPKGGIARADIVF